MATGVGHMRVDIPNGNESTAVTLKDVLYCPDLGYTLVSLAKCDMAGFTVVLKDKSCCIKDSKGIQIGKIPQKQGLYRVDDDAAANIAAYTGVRMHTADELHRKMGPSHR